MLLYYQHRCQTRSVAGNCYKNEESKSQAEELVCRTLLCLVAAFAKQEIMPDIEVKLPKFRKAPGTPGESVSNAQTPSSGPDLETLPPKPERRGTIFAPKSSEPAEDPMATPGLGFQDLGFRV